MWSNKQVGVGLDKPPQTCPAALVSSLLAPSASGTGRRDPPAPWELVHPKRAGMGGRAAVRSPLLCTPSVDVAARKHGRGVTISCCGCAQPRRDSSNFWELLSPWGRLKACWEAQHPPTACWKFPSGLPRFACWCFAALSCWPGPLRQRPWVYLQGSWMKRKCICLGKGWAPAFF